MLFGELHSTGRCCYLPDPLRHLSHHHFSRHLPNFIYHPASFSLISTVFAHHLRSPITDIYNAFIYSLHLGLRPRHRSRSSPRPRPWRHRPTRRRRNRRGQPGRSILRRDAPRQQNDRHSRLRRRHQQLQRHRRELPGLAFRPPRSQSRALL